MVWPIATSLTAGHQGNFGSTGVMGQCQGTKYGALML